MEKRAAITTETPDTEDVCSEKQAGETKLVDRLDNDVTKRLAETAAKEEHGCCGGRCKVRQEEKD